MRKSGIIRPKNHKLSKIKHMKQIDYKTNETEDEIDETERNIKSFDGAVSYADNIRDRKLPIETIKRNTYYRVRFQKLEINKNTTIIHLEDDISVITCVTENVIIESLPTNITVGTACIMLDKDF